MRFGYILLAILSCLCIVFGAERRKATGQSRLASRIISTHEKIVELREQKLLDCQLIDDFPKELIDICW